MNDLTPEAIAEYPLPKGVGGYRAKEVDELLDRVADRIEQLEGMVRQRDAELVTAREQAAEAAATEATLKRTLLTAQRAAEETLDQARAQAEEVVTSAREEADRIRQQAETDSQELREQIVREAEQARNDAERARRDAQLYLTRLRGASAQFRERMGEHLDAHRQLLDSLPDVEVPTDPGQRPDDPSLERRSEAGLERRSEAGETARGRRLDSMRESQALVHHQYRRPLDPVRREILHGFKIAMERRDAVIPRGSRGWSGTRRPVLLGPLHLCVTGIAAEVEDVVLRPAHVLHQLPGRVRHARGDLAAQASRQAGDGAVKAHVEHQIIVSGRRTISFANS